MSREAQVFPAPCPGTHDYYVYVAATAIVAGALLACPLIWPLVLPKWQW